MMNSVDVAIFNDSTSYTAEIQAVFEKIPERGRTGKTTDFIPSIYRIYVCKINIAHSKPLAVAKSGIRRFSVRRMVFYICG
jgi:hypothetical protein